MLLLVTGWALRHAPQSPSTLVQHACMIGILSLVPGIVALLTTCAGGEESRRDESVLATTSCKYRCMPLLWIARLVSGNV